MTFFPTTVLVGLDGTPAARHALLAAVELCRATGSELHLVHVKLRRPLLHGQPMTPQQRERTDDEAAALLDRERAAAAEHGIEVAGAHLRYADRIEQGFAEVQAEIDAGLLVIGETGGASGLVQRLTSGEPSGTSTLRRSETSVLVVRPARRR